MPDLTFIAFPGKDTKEHLVDLDNQGKRFPIAESILNTQDPDNSGWEIKEDITIKAGTKVHIEVWNGKTKAKGTKILNIKIRPFMDALEDKKARESKKNTDEPLTF